MLPHFWSIILIFIFIFKTCHSKVIDIQVVSPGILSNISASAITMGGPAYDLGFDRLRQIMPDFNITHTYLYEDNIPECDTLQREVQNFLARWYYRDRRSDCMTVIITPGCVEAAQLNQLAAAWDVLLITTANTDSTLHDKTKSPTWVTTNLYPSSYYGDVFFKLMLYHGWKSIEILLDENSSGFFGVTAKLLNDLLKAHDLQVVNRVYSSAVKSFAFDFHGFLTDFASRNRVLLFLGRPEQLRKLLIMADSLNMTNDDYVYICALPFIWKGYGNYGWQYGDAQDEIVQKAYRSLLLITMIDLQANKPKDLDMLVTSWKNIFSKVPFYRNTRLQVDPPLPQLTSTTAAIEIFGQVLNETDRNDPIFDPTRSNGHLLADRMINRTFITSVGNISFDRFGERRPLLVTSAYFDPITSQFTVYIQSDINEGDFQWGNIQPVIWHNRSEQLPPSKPLCGFRGICLVSGYSSTTSLLAVLLPLFVVILTTAFLFKKFHVCCDQVDDLWWQINDPSFHYRRSFKSFSRMSDSWR